MDRRDELTWAVVELTPLGEAKVDEGTLEGTLRADLDVGLTFPIFIPATTYKKGGRAHVITLMQGYVFVGSGLPDVVYYRLEQKPYVSQVISSVSGPHEMRALSTIPDKRIRDMRHQLRQKVSSDIKPGDWVAVIKGTHRSLEGEVMGMEADDAFVKIELRSIKLIATIPLVFLEVGLRSDGC